jgi:ribosomal protein L11 methyltransferase
MPRWFEIAVSVPATLVDEAAALLDFAGFGGVEIREKGDTCDMVVVVETDDITARAAAARDAVAVLGGGEPVVAELDPKIWTENWKKHFARKTFADRIEVRPPWEEENASPNGLLSIVINPGMAFGTGLHETTAGCLELLVDEVKPGFVVADVGCGSGILAIAAAKLGAKDVLATDVDPLAIEATAENIASNCVAGLVRVELEPGEVGIPEWENSARPGLTSERSLRRAADERATKDAASSNFSPDARDSTQRDAIVDEATVGLASGERGTPNGASGGGFAACARASFDLVVANILAETLVEMCETLTSAVKPGGSLVLSGIEARRLKSVEEAFIRSPWRLERTITRGDWVSLSLHHDALAGPKQNAS